MVPGSRSSHSADRNGEFPFSWAQHHSPLVLLFASSPPFEILFISMRLYPMPEVLPLVRPRWSTAIDRVRECHTTSSSLSIWGCTNISSPTLAYLRDRSARHACATLTGIPMDVHPSMDDIPTGAVNLEESEDESWCHCWGAEHGAHIHRLSV